MSSEKERVIGKFGFPRLERSADRNSEYFGVCAAWLESLSRGTTMRRAILQVLEEQYLEKGQDREEGLTTCEFSSHCRCNGGCIVMLPFDGALLIAAVSEVLFFISLPWRPFDYSISVLQKFTLSRHRSGLMDSGKSGFFFSPLGAFLVCLAADRTGSMSAHGTSLNYKPRFFYSFNRRSSVR